MGLEDKAISYPNPPQLETGEFEKFFLTNRGLLEYSALPKTLQSQGVHSYARWLSRLTLSNGLERAGVAYSPPPFDSIVYPQNPTLGEPGRVAPEYPDKTRGYLVIVDDHTHPRNTCLSPDDIAIAISGYDHGQIALAHIVSTTREDFAWVRTKDTQTAPREEVNRDLRSLVRDMAAFQNFFIRQAEAVANEIESDSSRAFRATMNMFNGEYNTFWKNRSDTLFLSFAMAQMYGFGFYRGDLIGVFTQIATMDDLEKATTLSLREATSDYIT